MPCLAQGVGEEEDPHEPLRDGGAGGSMQLALAGLGDDRHLAHPELLLPPGSVDYSRVDDVGTSSRLLALAEQMLMRVIHPSNIVSHRSRLRSQASTVESSQEVAVDEPARRPAIISKSALVRKAGALEGQTRRGVDAEHVSIDSMETQRTKRMAAECVDRFRSEAASPGAEIANHDT